MVWWVWGLAVAARFCWSLQAAFAAVREDGSVITWGAAYAGGDCRDVKDSQRELSQRWFQEA